MKIPPPFPKPTGISKQLVCLSCESFVCDGEAREFSHSHTSLGLLRTACVMGCVLCNSMRAASPVTTELIDLRKHATHDASSTKQGSGCVHTRQTRCGVHRQATPPPHPAPSVCPHPDGELSALAHPCISSPGCSYSSTPCHAPARAADLAAAASREICATPCCSCRGDDGSRSAARHRRGKRPATQRAAL